MNARVWLLTIWATSLLWLAGIWSDLADESGRIVRTPVEHHEQIPPHLPGFTAEEIDDIRTAGR
ncbi:MAG: hypothetical protein WD118_09110 [Phycisphaeraceae bacterium]